MGNQSIPSLPHYRNIIGRGGNDSLKVAEEKSNSWSSIQKFKTKGSGFETLQGSVVRQLQLLLVLPGSTQPPKPNSIFIWLCYCSSSLPQSQAEIVGIVGIKNTKQSLVYI